MPTMPTERTNYTVPLTDDERSAIDRKMRVYGYHQFAAFMRFAAEQLPDKKKT